MKSCLLIFITATVAIVSANAEDCKGCVPLDTITFDKVISKFKAAVVKFDVAFPFGNMHEEFGSVAETTKDVEDLLVAIVGVKDFGDKDNADLAKRFDIDKKDFPVVLLFVQGQTKPIKLLSKENEQDFTATNIKRLVRAKTGIYLGLPGCVEQLDRLAEEFKIADEKERQEILSKARDFEMTLPEQHRLAAKVYVKMMEKILEKGDEFVQSEHTRIDGLLKGKLSNDKKRTMEEKKNILQSFAHKDEL
ncbi:endoplasmic reticulum resident protein 29 [Microplitis demolitor]|uniref:endoplasmic reticulum resident protein 29 n=1 Tax=Microplitis demolitor TaxID=69319 RepID=UPI0004CD2A8A|nr:endoplasmic reticulum resident protein 29 [Microplitis demolitor]